MSVLKLIVTLDLLAVFLTAAYGVWMAIFADDTHPMAIVLSVVFSVVAIAGVIVFFAGLYALSSEIVRYLA